MRQAIARRARATAARLRSVPWGAGERHVVLAPHPRVGGAAPGARGAAASHPLGARLRWGAARLTFIGAAGLSLGTVVAGPLLAPLISRWMFGDWRFWRHLRRGLRLYGHGYRLMGLMVRGDSAFMLGVPLTSPPLSDPAPGTVVLNPDWSHGSSCGTCNRCCHHGRDIHCPVLDAETGLCTGYDGWFWRYFNCGRFPSHQRELDYYRCPKWHLRHPSAPGGEGGG